jgi:FkbM family methyltransferase
VSGIPWGLVWHLWRAARTTAERRSVLAVLVRNLRARLSGGGGEVRLHTGGLTCYAGVHSGELYAFYEVFVRRVYESLPDFAPRSGSVVVDVGANIGMFALRHALAGARVFAVEPHPGAFGRLRRNIGANALDGRITALSCALGAENGWARLVDAPVTPLTRALPDPSGTVQLRTLDDLVADVGLKRIDLLKLDVEGAEVEVLCGGRTTLPRVQRLVLEVHSPALLSPVRALAAAGGLCPVYATGGYAYFRQVNGAAQAGTEEEPWIPA